MEVVTQLRRPTSEKIGMQIDPDLHLVLHHPRFRGLEPLRDGRGYRLRWVNPGGHARAEEGQLDEIVRIVAEILRGSDVFEDEWRAARAAVAR
jgi:hypothetical protein